MSTSTAKVNPVEDIKGTTVGSVHPTPVEMIDNPFTGRSKHPKSNLSGASSKNGTPREKGKVSVLLGGGPSTDSKVQITVQNASLQSSSNVKDHLLQNENITFCEDPRRVPQRVVTR